MTTPTGVNGFWERARKNSKAGFDNVWNTIGKLGAPVNRLSNKLGSEAFWPTSLDKESDKAARILRSFCKDGFYQEERDGKGQPESPIQGKQRVLRRIPKEVVQKAVGLCIFTTMRTGLWISGSGGSGVLVARQDDGSWSPPSGIMLHTAGLGFLVGVDIYDCVIVINDRKALDGFTNVRVTLGGEMSAVAGPAGIGGVVDTEIHARQAPLFSYMKSRGLYAGVQVDGTIIIERSDENERFYSEKLTAREIVSGKVRHVPPEVRQLQETLKSAEGKENVDESLIPSEKPPADYELEDPPAHVFGVPDQEDTDPYGVRALQTEGLEIREAGTRAKPAEEEFEFKPTVTSPVNTTFQPAINAARSRRGTVASQSSPRVGSSRGSVSSHGSPLESVSPTPIQEGSPEKTTPSLPPREAPAKPDLGGDIAEERADEEFFEAASETTDQADENGLKIAMKDEESPVETDLAEMSLKEHTNVQKKTDYDIKE